jgi:hypothetical protein
MPFTRNFNKDFLGHPATQGHRRVGGQVTDEDGPPEDGLVIQLDKVARVEAHRKKAAPHILAAEKSGHSQRNMEWRFKKSQAACSARGGLACTLRQILSSYSAL